jgi:phage gp29-like protein
MVARPNWIQRLFRFSDQAESNQSVRTIHLVETGSTGTESYSGYNYEEYLNNLHGRLRAKKFDELRRSDAQIKMCLSAVKSPIRGATWEVEPYDQNDPDSVQDAEFAKHLLFEGMEKTFDDFLNEALTCLDFGHAVFEIIDKVVMDDPKWGTYNAIKSLAFRSQKTIERWNLDSTTDKLLSVSQYAFGDLQRLIDIPAEFLMVLSLEKEGSSYEGISAIRCCYGNWFRKNQYLKINAIGIEKFAIPTPMVEIPAGLENGAQFDNMVAVMEAYCSHEKGYLTYPAGWKIELNNNVYDPQKVEISIDNEDKRMVKSFMANFLELGMNGFGSQSLSFDLSDFFLGSIEHIAKLIASEVNRTVITRMIQMNRGPRKGYPKLKFSGISDRAGLDLSEVLRNLSMTKVIFPDDALESHVRKRYGFPEASETGRRDGDPKAASILDPTVPTPGNDLTPKLSEILNKRRARRRRV